MKTILFVCVENSCRSQIAEAWAKNLGKDIVESYSAGSKPSGLVNPMSMEAKVIKHQKAAQNPQ
ncbi:MAG: hypothetical protein AABZ57_03895 [Candidatus Margulisiibacteriota bacterium]